MPEFLFTPVPHDAAIAFIRSKPVVSRSVFDELLPELKGMAFTITGAIPADVQQTVRDLIATLPAGVPWDIAKQQIVGQISPYIVDPHADPEEREKQFAAAQAKAELLLRINGQQAYAASAHEVMVRNLGTHPFWEYRTMGDSKVRATHRALNGIILPASSPFWLTHSPPWDWGCRCIKIARTAADVDEVRARNAKDDFEGGRVIDGVLQRELELNNRLVLGMNNIVNVAPPPGANAWHWNPGDVRISVDDLRKRYDPAVFNAFESWARKTSIESDSASPARTRTVWNWINGEPGEPEVFRVSPGAAAPSKAGQPTRQSPVSGAFDVRIRDRAFRADMETTLALIDRAHDDGALPRLALRSGRRPGALGEFDPDRNVIEVRNKGPWRKLTLAHEAGHAIDYYAIGERATFSSNVDPALRAWRSAVNDSTSTQAIRDLPGLMNRLYFLSPREQFARSYAQYIAFKTQDPALLADVARVLSSSEPWRQWTWNDFAPIAKAFDDFFTQLGWIS